MQHYNQGDGRQLVTIVSGFSSAGYELYGRRFLDTYKEHCPYPLILYTEDLPQLGVGWLEQRDQSEISGLSDFLTRWNRHDNVAGRVPHPCWRAREIQSGYSFRTDAWKFCRMVFIMADAAKSLSGRMIWLDGDTVVRQTVPEDLTDRLLPAGKEFAFLGRGQAHSETGFLLFDLPASLPLIRRWADYYAQDEFLWFPEWHSAYLFDRAREACPEITGHDLTPGGKGHVIHQCEAGLYFDHLKGDRKRKGRSGEAKDIRGLGS